MSNRNATGKMIGFQLVAPLIVLAVTLCGCESPVEITTPCSEADFNAFAKPGDLTVSGQIPRYSSVPVHLDPATPYSDALYKALAHHSKFATVNEDDTAFVDPIMLKHRRTAVADSDGAFTFAHVAPGRYYVAWYDTWLEHSVAVSQGDPNPPAGITVSQQFSFDSPRGKWHFKQVTVHPGESLPDVDFD